jgi:hypothetical protein
MQDSAAAGQQHSAYYFLLAADHHLRHVSYMYQDEFTIRLYLSQFATLQLATTISVATAAYSITATRPQQLTHPAALTPPAPAALSSAVLSSCTNLCSCSAQKQQVSMQVTAGLTAAAATQMLMPLAAAAEVTPSLK